jgi:hypothetical protein
MTADVSYADTPSAIILDFMPNSHKPDQLTRKSTTTKKVQSNAFGGPIHPQ